MNWQYWMYENSSPSINANSTMRWNYIIIFSNVNCTMFVPCLPLKCAERSDRIVHSHIYKYGFHIVQIVNKAIRRHIKYSAQSYAKQAFEYNFWFCELFSQNVLKLLQKFRIGPLVLNFIITFFSFCMLHLSGKWNCVEHEWGYVLLDYWKWWAYLLLRNCVICS